MRGNQAVRGAGKDVFKVWRPGFLSGIATSFMEIQSKVTAQ